MLSLPNWLGKNKGAALDAPLKLARSTGKLSAAPTHIKGPWTWKTSVPSEGGQLLITRHSFRVGIE